jgi:hypothetical protein
MNLHDAGTVIRNTLITLTVIGVLVGIVYGAYYLDNKDKAHVTVTCCAPKGGTLANQVSIENHWWAVCRLASGELVVVDEGK